jgi:hypothetical protein
MLGRLLLNGRCSRARRRGSRWRIGRRRWIGCSRDGDRIPNFVLRSGEYVDLQEYDEPVERKEVILKVQKDAERTRLLP